MRATEDAVDMTFVKPLSPPIFRTASDDLHDYPVAFSHTRETVSVVRQKPDSQYLEGGDAFLSQAEHQAFLVCKSSDNLLKTKLHVTIAFVVKTEISPMRKRNPQRHLLALYV